MGSVAIVAIVAMLFGLLYAGNHAGRAGQPPYGSEGETPRPAPEVILYIDPPPPTHLLGLTLPDRNPHRG